ncbi:MAG: hypothetical protein KatS3mg102_2876 [Planctomycetota bacterium]|nr:MAG: hypothetical protein KatS3mg102_2876 [Planctomycetota bacterium]
MAGAGRSRGGFTLVELLVAIALMVIIVLQIQIIFNGARRLYERSDAMVQVFQNARAALDLLERDLRNAVKTDQMEFFDDVRTRAYGRGFYNDNEANPTLRGWFQPGVDYVHALAVRQPPGYEPTDRRQRGPEPYRHDALYFRTLASLGGPPKEVLVAYELWLGDDPARPRRWPVLRRTVVEVEKIDPSSGNPVVKIHPPMDVCYYVQEFKVELFIRDRARGTLGRFYSAREAVQGGQPPPGDPYPPLLRNYASGGTSMLMCVERGEGDLTRQGQLVVRDPLRQLAPGDRMYVLTKPLGQFRTDFGKHLVVRQVDRTSTPGQTRVSFEEEVELVSQLASRPEDAIRVDWRHGWLPGAIRVTLRIIDGRSVEARTIQRTFELPRS